MSNLILGALLIVCLMFSAFFSSSETAFISLQKLRLKHLARKGESRAERVTRIMAKPAKLLTTILLGNNLFNTAAASIGTLIFINILGRQSGQAVLLATITVTLLLLILSEIAPKILATDHGERLAFVYAIPIEIISWILYPFVIVLNFIGGGIARLIGGRPKRKALVSEAEIRTIITVGQEEGVVEKAEAGMMSKVFEFGDRHVREAMVPRPDIVWINRDATLKDFFELYVKHSHSNYPVYDDSIDNIVGIVKAKDIFLAQAKGELLPQSPISGMAKPGYFAPESKHIGEMFSEMQAESKEIAIVVDEFGGTDGLVTMKQLAEEVVGHFGDELARRHKTYETIDEHTFLIDGGMRLDRANEEMGLSLPEGSYETVAGFVLSLLGHIPEEGEREVYRELTLIITKMKGTKIDKVLITKGGDTASQN
ncbi:hemolysin family protein [Chloroflexota bacterium]